MIINTLASGSKANGYVISDGITSIMLEAGVSPKTAMVKGVDISGLSSCLITHEHKDHSKFASEWSKILPMMIMSPGTKKTLGIEKFNVCGCTVMKTIKIGTLSILPFPVQHDAMEPVGYLIRSDKTGDKLLFATDTYYIRYLFPGLTEIMIECNYDREILDENVSAGLIPRVVRNRILQSHFSIENVMKYLEKCDLSKCRKIYLIHLSCQNSDGKRFKEAIERKFLIETEVNNCPF